MYLVIDGDDLAVDVFPAQEMFDPLADTPFSKVLFLACLHELFQFPKC